MTTVLVVHGTRDPAGAAVAYELADRVGASVAFVDVLGPGVREVLDQAPGPVTVVPAFLASGHHVRTDVPAAVHATGRSDVRITVPLGAGPDVLTAAADRLRAAGRRRRDAVVLAAAGSADARANDEVRGAARMLSLRLGCHVSVGYLGSAEPPAPVVVRRLRARGHRRVAVASLLLAPGLFHRAATACGADIVSEALGTHPAVLGRLRELAEPR